MRSWAATTSTEGDRQAAAEKQAETERQRQAFIARRSKEIETQQRANQTADVQRRAALEFDSRNPRGAA